MFQIDLLWTQQESPQRNPFQSRQFQGAHQSSARRHRQEEQGHQARQPQGTRLIPLKDIFSYQIHPQTDINYPL